MPIGAIGGALINSGATRDAAEQSAAAIRYGVDESRRQYNDTVERFQPFYETGTGALGDYQKMLQGGYDMEESPAAKYQRESATKAMNRAMASRGLSGSGNAVNRITELNSSIAGADWNNQYNRLLDAIKIGTGAASSAGQAGQAYANNAMSGANNLANVFQNQGNALSSIYQNASNQLQNGGLNVMALGTKNGWWGGSQPDVWSQYSAADLSGGM